MLEGFLWPVHSTGCGRPSFPAPHCTCNIALSAQLRMLVPAVCCLSTLSHTKLLKLTDDNEAVVPHQCTMVKSELVEERTAQRHQCFVSIKTIMPPKEATLQRAEFTAFSSLNAQSAARDALTDTQGDANLLYEAGAHLGRRLSVQLNLHRVL